MRTQADRGLAPIVIELAGPPGAGKTSLLPTVQRACEAVGLRPYTVEEAARAFAGRTSAGRVAGHLPAPLRRRVLWGIFSFGRAVGAARLACRRPAVALHVARTQLRRPADADVAVRRVVHWYVRMAGSYEFLRRHGRSGEALIIDEGFVHRVVQLHASTVERPERRQVARYVESLPPSDLLVLVRAPLDVCQQRVRTRGVWRRLQHRDDDDINRFVSNAHLAIAFAADALRGGVRPMVEIDNAGDLARAEITLKERLEEALSGSGSGPAAGSGAGPGEEAPWTSPRVRVPRMARVVDRIVDLLIVLSRVRLDRGQAFMAGYRKRTAIAADEWRDLFDVWEYDRLTGLVHSWRNHVTLGGEQRLVTARARVIEAEWAREQAGRPWR